MTRKHKAFIWIYLNLLGIKEGERLSDGAMLVRFLLMPLDTLYWVFHEWAKKRCMSRGIGYDPVFDVFAIYGVKYSGTVFRDWAKGGWPEGTLFRFGTREDGAFTLIKLGKGPSAT